MARHWLPTSLALVLCWTGSMPLHAQARDHVRVVGSSTLFPYATMVAERFGRQGRWRTPIVESVGTGGGFRLFCAGVGVATPDIVDASRPMTAVEIADCRKHGVGAVVGIRVGLDGMLLANARSAPAFSLTREQLFLAVARTVPARGRLVPNPYRRWREISPALPDLPISIYGPAPNHGTRDAFVALAMVPACERFPEIRVLQQAVRQQYCQSVREDGAWIDISGDYALLFARLVANPDALGVIGFSYLERNRDQIKAATIDGIAPTIEAISAWTYPLSRPLFIYVKRAHIGRIPGLDEFVQEFLSDRAIGPRGYLVEQGLTPQPAAWLQAERAKATRQLQPAK